MEIFDNTTKIVRDDLKNTLIHAVVRGEKPGVIFVLKNINTKINIENQNRLHPFYMVYIGNDGTVICNHLQPKDTLDIMRDSSLASDSVATNFEQIFATYSPTTVRKVL